MSLTGTAVAAAAALADDVAAALVVAVAVAVPNLPPRVHLYILMLPTANVS